MGQRVSAQAVDKKYPLLKRECVKYPKPQKDLKYGTAGFRDRAEYLDSTLFRMGMLAALRSRKTGYAVGLMVTASHNPERDNGVKMVDPNGGMMARSWEEYAELLANAPDNRVQAVLAQIYLRENIPLHSAGEESGLVPGCLQHANDDNRALAFVYLGKDTRSHSKRLAGLCKMGAEVMGAVVEDQGVLTTPQLHHCVRMANEEAASGPYWGKQEWNGEAGYYLMLASGFKLLLETIDPDKTKDKHLKKLVTSLLIDAANGVGGPKAAQLAEAVQAANIPGGFPYELRNTGEGSMNEGCGAEHCQKEVQPPAHFTASKDKSKRACSYDGDADRIVYHYFDDKGKWHLLDGDKIASLFATFLHEEMDKLGLTKDFSLAVVQTAYANGASTSFLKAQGVRLAITKTGVKFLHHEALRYDVGVYFEANGHGTVVFSDRLFQRLDKMAKPITEGGSALDYRQAAALKRMVAVRQVVNQAVGDAMSDMLLVEAILRLRGWKVKDWDNIYTDLPSRQVKVQVEDRSVVGCTQDETRAIRPQRLQAGLDLEMAKVEAGRCFVRPSGTEDVVRVYAEAATQEKADQLALKAVQLIHELCGGKGARPTKL